MIKVFLHGRLKPLLPSPGPLSLEVSSPAEAVRAVCALLSGARETLSEGEWRIAAGTEPVALDTLGLGLGACEELHIHPHAAAAGTGTVLCGPALIATAYALTSIPEIGDYAEREAPDRRASYLYRGAVNATEQGGRVPVIYGGPIRVGSTVISSGIDSERVQLTEPDGAGSRTPVEGGVTLQTRATLRAVDLIGEGPMRGPVNGLKSVYIDGTAVENPDGTRNMEGFHLSWRDGTAGQDPPEGILDVSVPGRFSEQLTHASPVTRTIQAKRDSARVTLRFPHLETITEAGEWLGASVRFKIEVQPAGGMFTTVVGPQTISDRSVAPAELSWRVLLEGGAPHTVRVTRESEDASADGVHNELYWVGLDEIAEVRPSYPHTALVGIEAEAEKFSAAHRREYEVYGRIVDVPSNYDPAVRTYTGDWDGTFKSAWTDNGAWCVFDLLRSRRYGLGGAIDAERLSAVKWALYTIARFNDELVDDGRGGTEPRYRFTGVIGAAADARRVLSDMLSNFRAAQYYAGGSIVPLQDAPEDPAARPRPPALLGPANVEGGTFDYAGAVAHGQRVSAVAVSFSDPNDGYKLGIELVLDDELVAKYGYRQKDIAAMHCTSRAQAHRHGRHVLVEQESESAIVRYRAGLDQASVRPGSVVRIADPLVAGDRAAGRILGVIATDTDTIYRLAETEPTAPAGGEDAEEHTPDGWTREQPVATLTESVWSAERNRTYAGDAFRSATAWGNVTEVDDPIAVTTDTDTIYRLGASEPAVLTGGQNLEAHTPAGWVRAQPTPTITESVWSAERTRTLHDGAFQSATVWGNVTEVQPPLTGTREIVFPAGTFGTGEGLIPWEGAVLIDPPLIAGGSVAYLRFVAMVAGSLKIRLAATPDGEPTDSGPEFTDAFKTADVAFTFTAASGPSLTVKGPGHADNTFSDPVEPYFWTPPDNTVVRDWFSDNAFDVITLTLGTVDSMPAFAAIAGIQATVGAVLDTELPAAIGGNPPFTYSLTGLPSPLQFDPATRRITGTPGAAGSHALTYRVEDADGDVATAEFDLVVAAAPSIAADTITADGAIARALITVGEAANWYSRHAGQSIGQASGDLSLDTDMTLSRVQFHTEFTRLRLNRTGTGTFSAWYTAGGAGAGKSVYLAFGTSLIEIDIGQQHLASGGSFLNLTVPDDAVAAVQAASVGDPVNFVIADSGTGSRA